METMLQWIFDGIELTIEQQIELEERMSEACHEWLEENGLPSDFRVYNHNGTDF